MIIGYRSITRHIVDIKRNATSVSSTGATKFNYGTPVAAVVVTNLIGLYVNIRYTARTAGAAGNSIVVTYVNNGANKPLAVTVQGTTVTVQLATDASGTVTTVANDVVSLINTDVALLQAELAQDQGINRLSPGSWQLSGGSDAPALLFTGVRCNIQTGGGRMRQEEFGQAASRRHRVLFGSEMFKQLQQNDLIIVKNPPGDEIFRIVHVHDVIQWGGNHVECDVETYTPGAAL